MLSRTRVRRRAVRCGAVVGLVLELRELLFEAADAGILFALADAAEELGVVVGGDDACLLYTSDAADE